ncbi:uncharacterized protein (DUF427 family) [Cryobacterium psychrotolerans]|nr:uncharacterized protein (DUF427 family) [Cryobacterium psychrotolerans]
MVDVHADLTHVTVRLNDQVIASPERAMGSAATITYSEHVTLGRYFGPGTPFR